MEHLTGKDLRQLSEFLCALYQLRSHDEFTTHLVAALPSITKGEFTFQIVRGIVVDQMLHPGEIQQCAHTIAPHDIFEAEKH